MRGAALLFPLLFGACAAGVPSMPAAPGPDPLDALMQEYAVRVPGAAVLVVRDGEPVVRRGYGLADLESGTAVGAGSRIRLASLSKQSPAPAVLLLGQDGRLALGDPTPQSLRSLPPAARGVPLRHLLTHT